MPLGGTSVQDVRYHLVGTARLFPKRNVPARLMFLILTIFLAMPVFYLHVHLMHTTTPHDDTHHQPVHQKLKHFHKKVPGKGKSTRQKPLRRVLTAYLESPATLQTTRGRLQVRNATSQSLKKITFPQIFGCSHNVPILPIDDFPTEDPFLPWLHDYFVSKDGRQIQFVAQNRRRCDTGEDHIETMKYWEPQVALFQRVPVVRGDQNHFRLASSLEEATDRATRFQCRFRHAESNKTQITMSTYKFDYEYVTRRKMRSPMLDRRASKDATLFWLSTLLFSCPIPKEWQPLLKSSNGASNLPKIYLDLAPIRTPARTKFLLSADQIGPDSFAHLNKFNLNETFGQDNFLPSIDDVGRWENLPLCPQRQEDKQERVKSVPKYQFVACTWTASSYTRRGDATRVSDAAQRLREWILFHLMVGVEHVYIYDNTDPNSNSTEILQVLQEFPASQVTYHSWPCKVCNNNRPNHPNPGERSSQYAAEASCRERYGPYTNWMTFLDVDEYLVPMEKDLTHEYNWLPILEKMYNDNATIVQFLSSRAKPRVELMEEMEDQSACMNPSAKTQEKFPNTDACLGPRRGETFLHIYNCEYIRPPKPQRFERARKQIYRPSYVWNHFIHYSPITASIAETYAEFQSTHSSLEEYSPKAGGGSWERGHKEIFVDELNTGVLVHTRSVLSHETRRRSSECFLKSKISCAVGYLCDDSVKFNDANHQKNIFQNPNGTYCNCWKNEVVEANLVPRLEKELQSHMERLKLKRT